MALIARTTSLDTIPDPGMGWMTGTSYHDGLYPFTGYRELPMIDTRQDLDAMIERIARHGRPAPIPLLLTYEPKRNTDYSASLVSPYFGPNYHAVQRQCYETVVNIFYQALLGLKKEDYE